MRERFLIRALFVSMCLVVCCCTVNAQQTTGRVHAIIISGGMNKLMNHERYWNDCAFLYRTLREDYRLSPQDITSLISDGGEPGRDMLLEDGSGFATSPADLDGDGLRDVWLPATLSQVEASLTELAMRLTPQDRLFLFLVDHGDIDDQQQTYACMWGGERLTDTRLAELLDAFHVASMNIVIGMCHSGGFIDDLWRENRIISTSSTGSEPSWACGDRPYDEFVYHWTCAIAGHDPEGNLVTADADGDGFVTMAEAFNYACQHDRREETPQYCSAPTTLGEQWSFSQQRRDGIKDSVISDLYSSRRCYDLQGRIVPTQIETKRKYLKILNAKQSFGLSPIIIIK